MKNETSQLGQWGESIACNMLVGKGYAIIGRNMRIGRIEIDILVMKDNRVAVVEVKTRRHPDEDPTFGIDRQKVMRLAKAGTAYLRANELPHELQIDLVFITGSPDDGYTVDHRPDAFLPPRKSIR